MRERYGAKRNPKKRDEKKINNLNVTHIYLFIQKKERTSFEEIHPNYSKPQFIEKRAPPKKKTKKKFTNEWKKEKE